MKKLLKAKLSLNYCQISSNTHFISSVSLDDDDGWHTIIKKDKKQKKREERGETPIEERYIAMERQPVVMEEPVAIETEEKQEPAPASPQEQRQKKKKEKKAKKVSFVIVFRFWMIRSLQTVQTQIRLILLIENTKSPLVN